MRNDECGMRNNLRDSQQGHSAFRIHHSAFIMIVGTARITLYLPENYSLKDKRQDLKSILARVINQYHVAAAEIADHENWQRATIGVACVSSDGRHANEILSKVVNFVENNLQQGGLEDYEIEILHLS
jgi:uncharacterized protein YlxP (DUF503 family)